MSSSRLSALSLFLLLSVAMFYSAQAFASGTNATACASVANASRGLTNTSGDSSEALDSDNLIQNGGFEIPVIAVGSYKIFEVGESFGGWEVVGAPGNVNPVSGQYTYGSLRFPAKEGAQFLDLTGRSNSPTGVSQTVSTEPGKTYTLTFWVGNIYDPGGIFGVSSMVIVKANGNSVCKATNSQRSRTQVWQKFTTPIKATSSETTISFINGDPPNDTSNGLDEVRMVPAAH